ncbi:hypothetical protein ABIA85_009718 [Bradyrhizobium sp. LA6.10]
MRTGRPKATLYRATNARIFGHNAVALFAGGTDIAGEDRAGVRARAQQRRRGNAVWRRSHTICKWRSRFITDRIEGLYDEMRSGRPARLRMRRWPS